MGVMRTPTFYKSLTFDGESSRDYGVYITGEAAFNAPARSVEMVSIPGRNGAYALDKGHFENIEVIYPAGIFAENEADFAAAISDFRNYLCSRSGYCRLTDEYNPDEYRLAVYKSGLEVDPARLIAGEFDIVFDCKPQRYLTSGEEFIEVGEWADVETAEGAVVSVDVDSEDTKVKSLTADINAVQDLHGYDKPWVGGAGKNKIPNLASTETKNGITFTVNSDGSVKVTGTASADTVCYMLPSASLALDAYLTSGQSYILSGCPSGGSSSTYLLQLMVNGSTWYEDVGSGKTFTYSPTSGNALVRILIKSGTALGTSGITFYPMVRLSSVSDATYAPYSNICPISGSTEVNTYVTGKNLFNPSNVLTGFLNYNTQQISSNANAKTIYVPCAPNTKYTVSKTAGARFGVAYTKETPAVGVSIYGATNNNTGTSLTITTGADAKYLVSFVYLSTADTATESAILGSVQVELGETATTYEAYNGNTYTTALGTTIYGGTLDVVSGELTVTHKKLTLDGTQTLTDRISNQNRVWIVLNDMLAGSALDDNLSKCDKLPKVAVPNSYTYPGIGIGSQGNAAIYITGVSYISGVTDLASLNTWLTNNPVTLTYPLATPQTYQLTPQQVELLLGTNYVWANSGDVTLEYGHNPMVLANPTQFDSEPLLAITGYGEIGFNGYTIDVGSVAIGDVILSSGVADSFLSRTITINGATLMTGDTITINGIKNTEGHSVKAGATITNTNFGVLVNCVGNVSDNNRTLQMVADPMTFTYGTASTSTASLSFGVSYSDVGSHYYSSPCAMTVEYDGADTFTIKTPVIIGANGPYSSYSRSVTVSQITAYSTKLATNNIAYIDCEIGECWMESGGAIVSLNNVVTLGSDLPTLASGTNTFTYDNTVTDLKVAPRWWKV